MYLLYGIHNGPERERRGAGIEVAFEQTCRYLLDLGFVLVDTMRKSYVYIAGVCSRPLFKPLFAALFWGADVKSMCFDKIWSHSGKGLFGRSEERENVQLMCSTF